MDCAARPGGAGRRLSRAIKALSEARLGYDFCSVRIHADAESATLAAGLSARAYTVGRHIAFGAAQYAPETAAGRRLLAHELVHVAQQGFAPQIPRHPGSRPVVSHLPVGIARKGLLSQRDAESAARYNAYHYRPASIMIIQSVTGAHVTGRMDRFSAESVATFQQAPPAIGVDGRVGEQTLNKMVPYLHRVGRQAQAIRLVMDFYRLPKFEALSVRYDQSILGARTRFEAGVLRVVRIGRNLFRNATDLRDAIYAELMTYGPGTSITTLTKRHLSPAQEANAIKANKRRLQDLRMIVAVQDLIGAPDSAAIDAPTVQHIAEYQYRAHLKRIDGIIDPVDTLPKMVTKMIGLGYHNTVIRLLIDYFNLRVPSGVIDIRYGRRSQVVGTTVPGPTTVTIGRLSFTRGLAFLVHMIANQLEQARLTQLGVHDPALRIFLGEAVEILSKGMPEESIRYFMRDARRALHYWRLIARVQDKRKYWKRFEAVRNKFVRRYLHASSTVQARYANLYTRYIGEPPP